MKPAVYPVDIEITTYVGNPGRSSFMMLHEMYRAGEPAVLYAEAASVMVWIDISQGNSRPLPDWMRKELNVAI